MVGWLRSLRDRLAPDIRCESAALRLPAGYLCLRALTREDGERWRILRRDDEAVLRPVEPTASPSWAAVHARRRWDQIYDQMYDAASVGDLLPLVIELDGEFIGQLTLGNIQHGATRDCWIGYWIHSSYSGQSLATAAVALGLDLAFRQLGLHRVTATVMPSNGASRRVLEKNRFRREGYLRRSISIDGQWTDHEYFAITSEELEPPALEHVMHTAPVLAVIPAAELAKDAQ